MDIEYTHGIDFNMRNKFVMLRSITSKTKTLNLATLLIPMGSPQRVGVHQVGFIMFQPIVEVIEY